MQQRDFKKATTGFIHGFRYTVRALSAFWTSADPAGPGRAGAWKRHRKPWPTR